MNRHHAFVRAVSDRHRRSVAGVRDVPTALRRLHATWLDRSTHRLDVRSSTSTTWTLRPTVQILVGPAPRSAAGSPAGGRLELVPRRDRPPSIRPPVDRVLVHRFDSRHLVSTASPSAVQLARSARGGVEDRPLAAPTQRFAGPATPERSAAVAAVPTRLRRQSAAAPALEQSPAPSSPFGPGWELPGNVPGAMARTPVPAVPTGPDLDRLTDHVVAAIDRRFVAHRERTGRGW